MVPGGRESLSAANDAFKWRLCAWIAGAIAVALAAVFSGWLLLALLPVVLIDRSLEVKQQERRQSAAAILVALEILANDCAGWARAYPDAHELAARILHTELDKSEWLRCYRRVSEFDLSDHAESHRIQRELIRDAAI